MQLTPLTNGAFATLMLAVPALALTEVDAAPEQNDVASNQAMSQPCEANCMHRLFYRTAYSSAITGVEHAMSAYESFQWCAEDNKDWCPQVINTTVSAVAGNAVKTVPIDFENCGDQCLLTSLSTVSQNSALWAMRWAANAFNGTGNHNDNRVKKFHQSVWHLSNAKLAEIDTHKLNHAMSSHKSVHKPVHKPKSHSNKKHKDLAIGLPFLASPLALLGPFAVNKMYGADPVLCTAETLKHLRRLFDATKKILPKSDWLRFLSEKEASQAASTESTVPEWTDPLIEDVPEDPWSETSSEPSADLSESSDPSRLPTIPEDEAVEPGQMIRAERFNPETGRREQQTLRQVDDDVEQPLMNMKPGVDAGKSLLDNGFKPYEALEPDGSVEQWLPHHFEKLPRDRILWHRPEDLEPMEGDWSKVDGRYVRLDNGAPALDSLGEPLIANEASTLLTLEAEAMSGVRFDDMISYWLFDADDRLLKGSKSKVRHSLKRKSTRYVDAEPPVDPAAPGAPPPATPWTDPLVDNPPDDPWDDSDHSDSDDSSSDSSSDDDGEDDDEDDDEDDSPMPTEVPETIVHETTQLAETPKAHHSKTHHSKPLKTHHPKTVKTHH